MSQISRFLGQEIRKINKSFTDQDILNIEKILIDNNWPATYEEPSNSMSIEEVVTEYIKGLNKLGNQIRCTVCHEFTDSNNLDNRFIEPVCLWCGDKSDI